MQKEIIKYGPYPEKKGNNKSVPQETKTVDLLTKDFNQLF